MLMLGFIPILLIIIGLGGRTIALAPATPSPDPDPIAFPMFVDDAFGADNRSSFFLSVRKRSKSIPISFKGLLFAAQAHI